MSRIKIILGLMWLCLSPFTNLFAQQEVQFTQYNDNMLYYNPAYAGSRDQLSISLFHRQQWVGFKGAPVSQSLSLHSPLAYESVGVGLNVINDNVGPLNQTWINGDFSYSFKVNNKGAKLSFGLNAGVNVLSAEFSDLTLIDSDDPVFDQGSSSRVLPNFGAGVYYHTKHFYAGLSIPRFIESNPKAGRLSIEDQRHYYFSMGGYIDVNRMLKVRPSTLFKVTENAPFALDASLAFIFYDKLWLGANYRLAESIGVLVQYQISNQFKIGYSLDISTSNLVKYNAGTHEVMISYDLKYNRRKIISPRTMTYYF